MHIDLKLPECKFQITQNLILSLSKTNIKSFCNFLLILEMDKHQSNLGKNTISWQSQW